MHKERYELLCDDRQLFGKLKTSIYLGGTELYPTTGDFVTVQNNPGGDSTILQTHPRKSFFSRLDPDKTRPREQAVAANFDTVFLMASLNHDFNLRRMERYLALSWQSGALPVIILTKADLVADYQAQIRALEKIAGGAEIFAVSAVTGQGLDALDKYMKPGNTVVFLGSSGVGKSSLVNALLGEELMAVNVTRHVDASKGRHTTTHRQLITLPGGAMIIDTPGMRELGMWGADAGLSEAFSDVESYGGRCKFSDCRHQGEPGCAVRAAMESGELPEERWESYLKLKRELDYVDNKTAFLQKKSEQNKAISQWSKRIKKERNR